MCEICDADFDPADAGGMVTFQPDDRSREWRRRAAEEPGFVGHPPNVGWFCAAHIHAARDAARTSNFAEGIRRVRADVDAAAALASAPADAPGLESESVEWSLEPIDAHEFASSLCSVLPPLFEVLALGAAPALAVRADRRWTPMDGAQPPWCPFTDTTLHSGIGTDGTPIDVTVVLNHWNEDEVANASVSLTIGDRLSLSAFTANGAGRNIDTLRLRRPATAGVVAVVETLLC